MSGGCEANQASQQGTETESKVKYDQLGAFDLIFRIDGILHATFMLNMAEDLLRLQVLGGLIRVFLSFPGTLDVQSTHSFNKLGEIQDRIVLSEQD